MCVSLYPFKPNGAFFLIIHNTFKSFPLWLLNLTYSIISSLIVENNVKQPMKSSMLSFTIIAKKKAVNVKSNKSSLWSIPTHIAYISILSVSIVETSNPSYKNLSISASNLTSFAMPLMPLPYHAKLKTFSIFANPTASSSRYFIFIRSIIGLL